MVPPDCGVVDVGVVEGLVVLPHPAKAKLEASNKPEARATELRFKRSPPYFYAIKLSQGVNLAIYFDKESKIPALTTEDLT